MGVNYILGNGESLTKKINAPGGGGGKTHPYTFKDSHARFLSSVRALELSHEHLSDDACPDGQVVSLMTLHPTYLARSHFPDTLLREVGFRSVGSRARSVVPAVPSPKHARGDEETAMQLFVSGDRQQLSRVLVMAKGWSEKHPVAEDVQKVESLEPIDPASKIRTAPYDMTPTWWEAVLHAGKQNKDVVDAFDTYVTACNGAVDMDRMFHAGGLTFVAVHCEFDQVASFADFSMLRILRGMPRLRPVTRCIGSPKTFDCKLPNEPAIDQQTRAVIYDGGPVDIEGVDSWVTNRDAEGVEGTLDDFREHAIGVMSSFLFGPIERGKPLPRPYCNVEVVRVLDERTPRHGPDYFDVLARIDSDLEKNDYDFVNLSIGPDWPIEDDGPHAWSAVLDQRFAEKPALAFCAVGNNGEKDWDSGNARVMPPSDCVNVLAIGSCDSLGDYWGRSAHSCIGEGRQPGLVRPELLAFGGEDNNPYFVLGTARETAIPVSGTSYAAPTGMRTGAGLRAYLGEKVKPLAIRALLVNRCVSNHDIAQRECGWGRISHSPEELLVTDDTTANVIYQRTIKPAEWIRAEVPIPAERMQGYVYFSATLCYRTKTDPQDPVNYTRAGLEVRFRPNKERLDGKSVKSRPLFVPKKMYPETEAELRDDCQKWETLMHVRDRMNGSGLNDPAIDIHYVAREGGTEAASAEPIEFALVVTVHCKNAKDLYNQVVRRYQTRLRALTPVVRVPVGIQA